MQQKHHAKSVRKHAAIMFTDITGYTALMGSDEKRALEILQKNREIHRREVKRFGGNIIKEMGDGMLVSFALASEAVYCAINIQEEARRQAVPLKVGIHEGEILFEGSDVLGDGVNVAARLQEISETGTIVISNAVYRDVKNKAGIEIERMGEADLKNVDEPVNVYKVLWKKSDTAPVSQGIGNRWLFANKLTVIYIGAILIILSGLFIWYFVSGENNKAAPKTVAVLPFHDDSPDRDNEYFCNGMMEEILNHLQKISALEVKSRTSVEQYRNPSRDITKIGKELDVAFLLEGSVRKYEDDLRITAQLIDARTGNHLWSEVYDGEFSPEIFGFQSKVAKSIAASMNAIITPEEVGRIEQQPTQNMEAYDLVKQASFENKNYWIDNNQQHLVKAHKLVDEALAIDPSYIGAMSLKGDIYNAQGKFDSAFYYAEKALEIDPDFGWAYGTRGEYYRFTGQYDKAIENFEIALQKFGNNNVETGKWYEFLIGFIYCTAKDDYRRGLPYLQRGFDIRDRNGGSECMMLALLFSEKGDFARADKYFNKMLQLEVSCGGIRTASMNLFLQHRFNELSAFLDTICVQQSCWQTCFRMGAYNNVFQGKLHEAEEKFRQYREIGGILDTPDSLVLGFAIWELGDDINGKRIIRSVINSFEKQLSTFDHWSLNLFLSYAYAIMGKREATLEYLSILADNYIPLRYIYALDQVTFYRKFEDDPDFEAVFTRLRHKVERAREELETIMESENISL